MNLTGKTILLSVIITVGLVVSSCGGDGKKVENDSIVDTVTTDSSSSIAQTEESSEDQDYDTPLKYTAARGYGLYGKVKSVKFENKGVVRFNELGNIEKNADVSYTYVSPTKYRTCDECSMFIIEFTDNERIEKDSKEIEPETRYKFDNLGRVVEHTYPENGWMPIVRIQYRYQGDSRFPSSMKSESYDELGSWGTICKFEYLDIDSHGNWTRRKVVSQESSEDFEGEDHENTEKTVGKPTEYIEKRIITYF